MVTIAISHIGKHYFHMAERDVLGCSKLWLFGFYSTEQTIIQWENH